MTLPERTCAEELLYALGRCGVDVLFLNAGSDSAPVQEAALVLADQGVPFPRIVASTFESVSLAAAHGYWQVTRRPQAVWVHVDAGTQNLGAMVHNVLRDRAGVVVLAGRTPYSDDPKVAGARSDSIHWKQDVPDQAGIVRSYAKWTHELTRAPETFRTVARAVQVAGSEVPGLAYLMVSRDVLMEPVCASPESAVSLAHPARFARPVAPSMSAAAVEEISGLLATAIRPVLVTTRVGRRPGATEALARLAEVAGCPVVGRPEAVNLPTDHPMACRDPARSAELIASADLVIVVEADVPWVPGAVQPPPSATIVMIDPDPVHATMPLWTYPADVSVVADGTTALAQLADAVSTRPTTAARSAVPVNVPAKRQSDGGLTADDVVLALNEVLRADDLVVDEAVTNKSALERLLVRTEPGTLFSNGGPGLGWSLGASVGIKLASPDHRVVAVLGDGSFLFGVPTSALCLAAEADAPFLAVVLNNDGYRASRLPVFELFPGGISSQRADAIGTRFRRPPDFAAIARACGGWGDSVAESSALVKCFGRALEAVESGVPAVVDVRLSSPS